MRLTNVAHLRLPFGRLLGYDVAASAPGRELPVSFDQRRHVGAGDRPGSWMALSFRLPEALEAAMADHGPETLATAWLAVIARHGTLRSVFVPGEDPEYPHLHEVEISPGGWIEHPIDPGQAVNDALRDVLDRACTPYARPSHRLLLLQTAAGSTVIIGADHSHIDMWSLLVIARDLLGALGRLRVGLAPDLPESPPFAEHTRALKDRPTAPDDVRERWREVLAASGDVMPRFPTSLGDVSEPRLERVEVRDVLDIDDSAAFGVEARDRGVSTLTLVVAAMTAVTLELAGEPLRAVFPVHSRFDASWHDSSGWFITNSVLESGDPAPQACSAAVKEAIRLGSWPLEDILEPWGGMPDAPGMFAISWLDLRRLPVRVDSVGLEAQYVGATIRTDGVMLWFVLDETGMHLRCRYPDTLEARMHVGRWLDALIARLQAEARASVGGLLRLEGRVYRVQRAVRADVPALMALLADDEVGAERESDDVTRYESAFDAVSRDQAHYLATVRDADDQIVGTMQMTMIPGLARAGAFRLQIEGLRVAASERGTGLGTAMLEWAHDHGRARGATVAQVATDNARGRARTFYSRLGYESHHVGLKRPL